MTQFKLLINDKEINVTCDDMVLLDGGSISFLCFIFENRPKMMIPTDSVQSLEMLERGEWVGTGFMSMVRGEI